MDFIESKGKTVDEAVFNGLLKMDLSIDEVKIEIVDSGGSLFKNAKVRLTKKPETDIHAAMASQEVERTNPRETASDRDNRQRRRRDRTASHRDQRRNGPREGYNQQRNHHQSPEAMDENFVPQEPENEAEKFLLGLFSRMGIGVRLQSHNEDGILKVDMSGRGMGLLIGRRGETLDALQYLTSLVVNSGKEEYTKVMLDTEGYRKKREETLKRLAARLADRVTKNGKRVVLEPMNPYERRILHATLQDYEKIYTYSEGEDPFRSVVVAMRNQEDDHSEEEKVAHTNV